ncbi:type 1 glutamine amidotransferase domain-containing protein [Peribacillus sp. TH14]|uniref:type 1 glutamine amidotransferase domain-containing protein n=1 Tax=Peribacillus sp. TH14 TaxID=2798481 RepID=UPI0019118D43|nr:type 1 glutamine amidotransferase domain-containing protein [Peribacillus sp. TH14]MBK5502848.1 type 1 glutamine amidotransferase [Peribacillus sp. TH14]
MRLKGKRVALLIEDDYQEMEAWYPAYRMQEEGATVVIVGSGTKSTYHSKLGYPMDADKSADEVNVDDFDAVIVPGGFAPDHMRLCKPMVNLVRDAYESGKLTAAICHGGWLLASAGAVRGQKVTGYLPIRDDVENAGGEWVDAEVVCDGNVITSRTPVDLPAFAREIVRYLEHASVASKV